MSWCADFELRGERDCEGPTELLLSYILPGRLKLPLLLLSLPASSGCVWARLCVPRNSNSTHHPCCFAWAGVLTSSSGGAYRHMNAVTFTNWRPGAVHGTTPHNHGLSSNKTALITSDCGTMRSPSIKWPDSPRAVRPPRCTRPGARRAAATGTGTAYSRTPYGEPLLQL